MSYCKTCNNKKVILKGYSQVIKNGVRVITKVYTPCPDCSNTKEINKLKPK